MKWRFIVVPLLYVFLFFLVIRPWDLGPSGIWVRISSLLLPLARILIPLAFLIVSVFVIAVSRKIAFVIPLLFHIIACFFCIDFYNWGVKPGTEFWFWTELILACVFAVVSIILTEVNQKKILTFLNRQTAWMLSVLGLFSNVGVILWTIFLVIAGKSGM